MSDFTKQKFGGLWTEQKLEMVSKYLNFYLIALKNKRFKKVYIDVFAGTGSILSKDEEKLMAGSAKRALKIEEKFDRYYFVEYDKDKVLELRNMVHSEFPDLEDRVDIRQGDANVKLFEILSEIDWTDTRGVLFIDPFATQFEWASLVEVSRTKSLDIWYLFPISALNRMLKTDGRMDPTWEKRVDRLLGDHEWKAAFYKTSPQQSLFGNEEIEKDGSVDNMREYITSKLRRVFPGVAPNPYVFRGPTNSPLFLFCFAVSNDNPVAIKLALKVAEHILNHT